MSAWQQRLALIALTARATGALALLWPSLREDEWAEGMEEVAGTFGLAAGTLATDWFEDLREAALRRKRAAAQPPRRPGTAARQSATLVRQPIRVDVARLPTAGLYRSIAESISVHPETALVNAQSEVQRVVANAHRDTIVDLSNRDPSSVGWRRVGVGDNCDFCRMLIARGAVYKKESARFASHTNCNCLAEPAFDDVRAREQVPTRVYEASESKAGWSQERRDKHNARIRDHIAKTNP